MGIVGMTRAEGAIWNVRALLVVETNKVDVQITRYNKNGKYWEVMPYRFDSLPWGVIKKVDEMVKRLLKSKKED